MSTTIDLKSRKNNFSNNKERKVRNRKYAKDREFIGGGAGRIFEGGYLSHNSSEYKSARKGAMLVYEGKGTSIIR